MYCNATKDDEVNCFISRPYLGNGRVTYCYCSGLVLVQI